MIKMKIKDGIFVVGIDDAPHKWGNPDTELFFIFCRGQYIERIDHATIEVDGFNSTETLLKTLKPIKDQFRIVVTHGITTGGFNVLDIEQISEELEAPVISVTENTPRGNFLEAIKNLPDYEKRKSLIEKAGPQHSTLTPTGKKKVYFQYKGLDESSVIQFLKKFAIRSRLPEQVLLAHKIATGWKVE